MKQEHMNKIDYKFNHNNKILFRKVFIALITKNQQAILCNTLNQCTQQLEKKNKKE